MKAIMYHYVRQYDPRLPHFRYLDVRNFAKQLDHFEKKYGFVTKDEFRKAINDKTLGDAKGKILLTFDDAMSFHYEFVFKELKKRKLWGIFYVPSQPYKNEKTPIVIEDTKKTERPYIIFFVSFRTSNAKR